MAETGPRGVLANEQVQDFFAKREEQYVGVAPDDVDIPPRLSEYDAADVDLTARVSRNYNTPLPIVVSPMTDLVGKRMTITASMNGFLAVVPPTFSIEDQRHIVRATKLHLNGLVDKKPITTTPGQTIGQVMKMLKDGDFHFTTVPVINEENGQFEGMLDQDHFDFLKNSRDVLVRDVMKPAGSLAIGDQGMLPQAAYDIMAKKMQRALPVTDPSTNELTGLFVWSDVQRVVEGNGIKHSLDSMGRLLTAAAVSTQLDSTGDHFDALDRFEAMGKDLNILMLDTSMGGGKYAQPCTKELKDLRDAKFPHVDLINGNMADDETAVMYAKMGLDGGRAGIGTGSICQTSSVLAIGSDGLSNTHRMALAAKQVDPDYTIIPDGGQRNGAIVSKSQAAGGDAVMVGRMVAGTKENPPKPYYNEKGEFVQQYRGQGSTELQKESAAASARYDGAYEEDEGRVVFSQGYKGEVPFVGGVMGVVREHMMAVRLAYADVGAHNHEEFQERARFRESSKNTQKGAHDIRVIGT